MKITLTQKFKSLNPFESEKLGNFVLITGKNGSGKSQLLDRIVNDRKIGNNNGTLLFDPAIKTIQFEGIDVNKTSTINHDNWKRIIDEEWRYFAGLDIDQKRGIDLLVSKNILNEENIMSLSEVDSDLGGLMERVVSINNLPEIVKAEFSYRKTALLSYLHFHNKDLTFLKRLAEYNEKLVSELQQIDFFRSPISEDMIDRNELFSSEMAMIFYNYIKRWDQNTRDYFDKKNNDRRNRAITEIEFLEKNPKPWEMINVILNKHGLDFSFDSLDRSDFHQDVTISIKLRKLSSGEEIQLKDLSSGEKVIIALIMKLFTSQYYKDNLKFPELLVLDEPDATLHPEMSKLLLDVLEQTFVQKFGIKVIMTTHSPSTVALAPEDSIYELKNGSESSLKRVYKDYALNLLTSFIPTLSIGYKNQRQVFVESPTDISYFQALHDKFLQDNKRTYSLYFISNAAGKGNCDLVYSIVNEIRNSGNATSFGIVDWDLKNNDKPFVFVHGKDSRYSIENFLLDPIYLMALFAGIGTGAWKVFEKIKKDSTYNQYNLGNESIYELQSIVDTYFEDFEAAFKGINNDAKFREVSYHNGKKLMFPTWYLEMQGHEIVTKLDKVYSGLSEKYRNEGDLQKALVVVMAKCYPFVPSESIEIIERIGNL